MTFNIIGTGSAHPEFSVTNDDLSRTLDTSDEWIYSRTGIKSRYLCTTESIGDIAAQAGKAALENAGVQASELDAIICSTIRGDYITPSLACSMEQKLGADCLSFDVNAACAGFLYALDVAAGYFSRKRAKKILIVSCEKMSSLLDWKDRKTCVLFGDGAGAVVLEEGDSLLSISLSAKGDPDMMNIPHVHGNSPYGQAPAQSPYLSMNGKEVYKYAVSCMVEDLKKVIQEAGLTQQKIDYVLPHQANMRIINTVEKQLGIPAERYCTNIESYGNVSSASIPILMDEMNRSGKFHGGDILALTAVGAGMTTGACILRWSGC